jgi:competence protein ComEC
MLSRERLWQRVSAVQAWPLAWALAAACALPWLLPETWPGNLPGWLLPSGGLLVLALLALRQGRAPALGLALLLITTWGLGRLARWEQSLPLGLQTVEGHVSAPWQLRPQLRTGSLTLAAPPALRGLELPLSLPAEGLPAPLPGTPVRVRAELRAVEPGPPLLGERPLWRARSDGHPRRLRLRSAEQLEVLGPPEPSPLLRFQVWVQARFNALPLEGTARDLWGALTLGIPPVQDEVFSAFAESGTIHTLVVSGLQVTLVMTALEALWRRLLRRGSGLAAVVGGLLYCACVGFTAPVWRGLVMGLAWVLGRSRGWALPPALSLHGALLLWLLAHPAAGCEPGFLLAWFALLGVLWGARPLAGLVSPLLGRTSLPLARLAAPWFTTLPLLALLHGGAPLWGVAANLLVLPLVALLTPICLALTLAPLPGLVPWIGQLLSWTGRVVVPAFARIQPLATGQLGPWLLLLLAWLALAHREARLGRTRALGATLVAASLALLATRGIGRSPESLVLEAVDVGQGDALLLRIPGGDATLVDTGPSPWSARRLARTLSRRGVREPLHLVLTHPHGDHAGGWATLARLWPLASTLRTDLADPVPAWAPYAGPELLGGSGTLLRGDAWRRGEAAFSVRWPPKPFALPDANMVSVVLRIRWRDRELWLMGDALGIQERDLLDLGDPGTGPWTEPWHRLLKVGHHGSEGTCDEAWLRLLRPELALLTASRGNSFGFPDATVLDRLKAVGCDPRTVGPAGGLRIIALDSGWRIDEGRGR